MFLLLLLGIIGFLILLGLTFFTHDRWGRDVFLRWGGLAGSTLALFGLFVADSEAFLSSRRFWLLCAGLLAVHLTAFSLVLTHAENWKLSWFMLMVFEYPVFPLFRNLLLVPVPEQAGNAGVSTAAQ